MFSALSLIPIILSTLVLAATPSLDLKVSGPATVVNVTNLKLSAIVTNTGNETVKLLNYPGSVLYESSPESFTVRHDAGGLGPEFTGTLPSTVMSAINEPSSFTILKPGESISVNHDLSSSYDFTRAGTGQYTFSALDTFVYENPETSKLNLAFARSVEAHRLSLSGSPTPLSVFQSLEKGIIPDAKFMGCPADNQTALLAAAAAAQTLTNMTAEYVANLTMGTDRFLIWFNTYNNASSKMVKDIFKNLNATSNNYTDYTYICETACRPRMATWVSPSKYKELHTCPLFFALPTDSQAALLVGQATEFNKIGKTMPVVGCPECAMNLAYYNPRMALRNFYNYVWFTANYEGLD